MKENNSRKFGDSMKARPVTSLAMIVLPTIILAFTHITVIPLKEMLDTQVNNVIQNMVMIFGYR